MTTFADRLTALRTRLGLSDAALARYLGVPNPTLAKWLRGERQPPAVALRLVEVLSMIEWMAPEVHAALIASK